MNTPSQSGINHPIEWAMETDHDPVFMIANWLVRDALDSDLDATTALTSAHTSEADLLKLKTIFKHLRVEGETKADRRLGAKLYAATIASGLVHHQKLISEQAPTRILQAFIDLENDRDLPEGIRSVARQATELMPDFA